MRPLLLLDVDGVLNPSAEPTSGTGGWADWQPLQDLPGPMRPLVGRTWASREQGAALADLGCAVEWATTWDHHAATTFGKHFGWQTYPTISWEPSKAITIPGHLESLSQHGGLPKLVVWVDDEHRPGGHLATDPRIESHLSALNCRVLRVGPDPRIGLTARQVACIANWLRT